MKKKKLNFCVCGGKAGTCGGRSWLLIRGKNASFPASGIGAHFLLSEKESSLWVTVV